LGDRSAHVRIAALRLAEARLEDAAMRRAVLALQADADVMVRRQLLYTLGASQAPDAEAARLDLLRRDAAVPFVIDAFMSGLEGRERRTLETLTDGATWVTDRPEHRALLTALATAVGNQGRPDGKVVLERLTADTRTVPGWQR